MKKTLIAISMLAATVGAVHADNPDLVLTPTNMYGLHQNQEVRIVELERKVAGMQKEITKFHARFRKLEKLKGVVGDFEPAADR